MIFDLPTFIAEQITGRRESLLRPDIEQHRETLRREVEGRTLCVIGGAGSIGSSFIRAILPFRPAKLVVIDRDENGLAELTRDLRSTPGLPLPADYRTYPIAFADPIFARLFRAERGFDIVANFSAHKHVRSEKDRYAVQALLENNDLRARELLELLTEHPPRHFFCVSTDKAANPVNIMGASKRMMEDLIMAYRDRFPVTTARFANVAFSAGSLPDGWLRRMMKRQPLVAPNDVKRYFVSPEESGEICMLACLLGRSGEIFFPKLKAEEMLSFQTICDRFVRAAGYEPSPCATEEEARRRAAERQPDDPHYPVFYFASDTTGEKPCEEFYTLDERINTERFRALGVIEESPRRTKAEVDALFAELETLFRQEEFEKSDVVATLKRFLPHFTHDEKGKNLDQKM